MNRKQGGAELYRRQQPGLVEWDQDKTGGAGMFFELIILAVLVAVVVVALRPPRK